MSLDIREIIKLRMSQHQRLTAALDHMNNIENIHELHSNSEIILFDMTCLTSMAAEIYQLHSFTGLSGLHFL